MEREIRLAALGKGQLENSSIGIILRRVSDSRGSRSTIPVVCRLKICGLEKVSTYMCTTTSVKEKQFLAMKKTTMALQSRTTRNHTYHSPNCCKSTPLASAIATRKSSQVTPVPSWRSKYKSMPFLNPSSVKSVLYMRVTSAPFE